MLKLWPPDAKNWLIWKDPDAGKDWRQEEKGTTEDEMIGWHYWLDGHEFVQALGVGDRQRGLVCSVHGESDTTELNWTEIMSDSSATPWTVAHQCSSVHDISQARILEWATISLSRGSSWSRDRTCVSCSERWIFFITDPPGKCLFWWLPLFSFMSS